MYKKLMLIIILISGLISCSKDSPSTKNSFDEELRIAIINNDIEKAKSIFEQVNNIATINEWRINCSFYKWKFRNS